MRADRRSVLRAAALGACAAGAGGRLLTRQARAQDAALRVLSSAEARTLSAVGETLAPGADAAGVSHYVDAQLAAPPADSLLMIRYLDVPAPHAPFYRAALAALDGLAVAQAGRGFADLSSDEAAGLVGRIASGDAPGWQGPPAPLVYFVLRADAADVVYGTEDGFAALGVPYMPHIAPPARW